MHIVDDEEAVRNSLAFLLSGAGFAVRVHESATEFLKIAPSITNGCLITDLRMPDIDGVELLKRLQAIDALLPAIVITGHGDVQMAVEAMKNGALDFIEKPFSDEVLIESIGRAVDKAAAERENDAVLEQIRQRLDSLSERERQVLKGVVAGHPNKVIAFDLGISPRTVEVYRASLMGKMQARSLPDLVRMVMDPGRTPVSEPSTCLDLAQSRRRPGFYLFGIVCRGHAERTERSMSTGRLLVVASDPDVRRSLVFALEAEGFEVTERDALPPLSWTSDHRFDCTVLDQRVLKGEAYESLAFCIRAHPVVLLAARPLAWLVEWVAQIVETPVIEDALVNAVRLAMQLH